MAHAQPLHDVAIVGRGPSGLIAALQMAAAGFDTVLVGPPAGGDQRTTALLDSSVQILDRLGLWQNLSRHAAALRGIRIVDDTGRLIRAPETLFDCAEIGLDAFGYNVLNRDLNRELGAAASAGGVTLADGFVTDILHREDRVELLVAGTERIAARLIVGADGRQSPVREAAGIPVKRWSYPQAALVCNLAHEHPHHDVSTEFHTAQGPFTLVPLPGERSSLVWVSSPQECDRLGGLDDDAFAMEAETRAHSFLGRMRLDGTRQVFPLGGMAAETVATRRTALIGEAAHVFPPIGAQGLNLSLRDVAALGDVCARARADGLDIGSETALAHYRAARRADIATRTVGVDLLNRTLLADFLPVQVVRSLGLYAAGRLAPLRRMLMREGVAPRFGGRR